MARPEYIALSIQALMDIGSARWVVGVNTGADGESDGSALVFCWGELFGGVEEVVVVEVVGVIVVGAGGMVVGA